MTESADRKLNEYLGTGFEVSTRFVHELKTWPAYFEQVWSGVKHHEVRKDDRPFKVGDDLWLREYDPEKKAYLARSVVVRVTSITRGPFMPEGLCVLGFQHVNRKNGLLCCQAVPVSTLGAGREAQGACLGGKVEVEEGHDAQVPGLQNWNEI